jgi:hypothetical protein
MRPMDAITVAMRCHVNDAADRIVWFLWLSAVLGLPAWHMEWLVGEEFVTGENQLAVCVPTVDEIRAATRTA